MKAIAILPAVAALLMLGVSVASSQEVCLKGYQTCMDTCVSRATAQLQDTCIQNCQAQNNACSDRVFGSRAPDPAVVNAPAASAPAKDAMAKKEPRGKKGQKKEEAKAPAAEAPAPAAAQAPAR